MPYDDLRQFVADLEAAGELKRITVPVSPDLEITEIADRVMKRGGPALLFERPGNFQIPVLINAFGSWKRINMALGASVEELAEEIGELFRTEPPTTFLDKVRLLPKIARISAAIPKKVRSGPCQDVV
ncbi:MAG: menaquinone biosynthesis decarboxylase, partial [Armatimonadota bacterium]